MSAVQHVFVMTYGRSGSTLLMGILNSIPGWLLRGENRHAMRHLYDFHASGLRERARVNPARSCQPTHPWFGIEGFDEQASLAGIRALAESTLLRPAPDTRVTGYKEIRWYDADLPDYLAFLQQVFPGCRFVLNTRHLPDVAASNFWTHKENPLQKLEEIEALMLSAVAGLGDAVHHVHYDDYVADPGVLRGLFDWLGEDWDPEAVARTMGTRHSRPARHRLEPGGPGA